MLSASPHCSSTAESCPSLHIKINDGNNVPPSRQNGGMQTHAARIAQNDVSLLQFIYNKNKIKKSKTIMSKGRKTVWNISLFSSSPPHSATQPYAVPFTTDEELSKYLKSNELSPRSCQIEYLAAAFFFYLKSVQFCIISGKTKFKPCSLLSSI